MLMLLSPAKTLDFEAQPTVEAFSEAPFLKYSAELIDALKTYSTDEIAKLMGLSDQLANLNVVRYQSWKKSRVVSLAKSAKQAVYAFKGDVYTGLDAEQFSAVQMNFAQKHLRILSGLYGLLQPLDVINPHRLEMGTKLRVGDNPDLYHFWGERVTQRLNQQLAAMKPSVVVNLASNEYFKVVQKKQLQAEVITPIFKDKKNGQYKIISFYAKKARGMMAAYAIKHKIKDPEQLKGFDTAGYAFVPEASSGQSWVFHRALEQA